MRISTATGMLDERVPLKTAIQILKDAGFDSFDLSLCGMKEEKKALFSPENYMASAHELRRYADSIGISCNQSHAPFPSSVGDETDEEIFQSLVRSIEISGIMGADIIVIHPVQHLNYAEYLRELFPMNVEFYKKLIPYAEKWNVKIATENMYQGNNCANIASDSVCSRSWEFCELVDAVDSPWLVGCLDIGHASMMGADIPKFIHAMGNKRLQALHIHDTDFIHDLHTLPFTHKIDYLAVCKALGEIDYQGDVTFEANNFYRSFPEPLLPSAAKLMADTGKFLRSEIQRHAADL